MKRAFDFILSFLAIVTLSPLIIMISIIIKTTSKGPVLFKQRRIGKDNKEFNIYKFRSMRTDTPNVATHLLTDPNQFITPVGKFLRKTSLDELPQLFNIIKGEMSIVGPRPALYNQYDLIEMRTKANVHLITPGLTGLAQVSGRDELELDEKVKYDQQYAQNISLRYDVEIILHTVFKVLMSDGVVEGSTYNNKKPNSQE